MIEIQTFTYNSFMENTYLLIDSENRQAIVVDAGMSFPEEKESFAQFVHDNNIRLIKHLLTHPHIDHVLGSEFILQEFGLYPEMHQEGLPILQETQHFIEVYGLPPADTIYPQKYLQEGDQIPLGAEVLDIIYTPGHAAGSVCIVNRTGKFVLTGDVLFKDTIGRTDLPTGDFDLLMHSIKQKVFPLGDDYTVYPGHGGTTNIGYEKANNPFLI